MRRGCQSMDIDIMWSIDSVKILRSLETVFSKQLVFSWPRGSSSSSMNLSFQLSWPIQKDGIRGRRLSLKNLNLIKADYVFFSLSLSPYRPPHAKEYRYVPANLSGLVGEGSSIELCIVSDVKHSKGSPPPLGLKYWQVLMLLLCCHAAMVGKRTNRQTYFLAISSWTPDLTQKIPKEIPKLWHVSNVVSKPAKIKPIHPNPQVVAAFASILTHSLIAVKSLFRRTGKKMEGRMWAASWHPGHQDFSEDVLMCYHVLTKVQGPSPPSAPSCSSHSRLYDFDLCRRDEAHDLPHQFLGSLGCGKHMQEHQHVRSRFQKSDCFRKSWDTWGMEGPWDFPNFAFK